MTVYLIRGGRVAAHATTSAKPPKGAIPVRSLAELKASGLPTARLVAIWNALPGNKRIAKFKSRKIGCERLWAALEQLAPGPETKQRPRAEKAARPDSKQAQVIELLRRSKGATIEELAVATGWQHHSVRGLLSGALKKRLGLTIASTKEERGRVYRIADSGAEE
jgi:uncharacterized protein DUF3489